MVKPPHRRSYRDYSDYKGSFLIGPSGCIEGVWDHGSYEKLLLRRRCASTKPKGLARQEDPLHGHRLQAEVHLGAVVEHLRSDLTEA